MVLERDKRFNMMLSEDELVMLRHLAEKDGVTSSNVLRALLRAAFKEAIGSKDEAKAIATLRARQVPKFSHE